MIRRTLREGRRGRVRCPGDVLDARSAVAASIRRHISDRARVSASRNAVAARAGHRWGATIIRGRHAAGVATRNGRRIATEIFISRALREGRVRRVRSPSDVLDASAGVTASIGRHIGDRAGMSATIGAVTAGAGDRRIGGAIIRRGDAAGIATGDRRRIATEVSVRSAGRERRLGCVNPPSHVLDARR